jgi:hypothetical protein
MGESASVEVTDFLYLKGEKSEAHPVVVRRIRVTRGSVTVKMQCSPRFDYARDTVAAKITEYSASWEHKVVGTLCMLSNTPLSDQDGDVVARFDLKSLTLKHIFCEFYNLGCSSNQQTKI